MAIVLEDVRDLIVLLRANPDLLDALRPLILSHGEADGATTLPEVARNLAALTFRFAEFERKFDAFRDEMYGFRDEIYGFRNEMYSFRNEMYSFRQETNARFNRIDGELGNLRGESLELHYEKNGRKWFGRWLRPIQLTIPDDIPEVETAFAAGRISDEEMEDLRFTDLLIAGRGRPTSPFPEQEVVLAIEISSVIDPRDVIRARRRADILNTAGCHGVAVCGGLSILDEASREARDLGVLIDLKRA